MAEPTRICPKCKQPQLTCRKIRIQSGANRREFKCEACGHAVAAPTKGSVIMTVIIVAIGMPVLLHFHPDYSLSDLGALPSTFWIIMAVVVAYCVYVSRAVIVFERASPVAA